MHLALKSLFCSGVPTTGAASVPALSPALRPLQPDTVSAAPCSCGYDAAFSMAALAGALPDEARSFAASAASTPSQCLHTHR